MSTGHLTSFAGLFTSDPGAPAHVSAVEIPLIQRDYAQGRSDGTSTDVRRRFLDVLHGAVEGGDPVGLDFVYGDVTDGVLRPLDGQQRLTTLYLLHWYLVVRTGRCMADLDLKPISYDTRPGVRLFCERLHAARPPADLTLPSTWITDQSWYLYVWDQDPSIQAMLVMLDAIHHRFAGVDADAAWDRLMDASSPAVTFHLLAVEDMGAGEDPYIKMNSRGKPLTPFENFKARFEKTLTATDPAIARDFAHKIDGTWSDLLWPIHGGDNTVDDEFMRLIEYLTEICEWLEGRVEVGDLEPRARTVFGPGNPRAQEHLSFLFGAFEAWATAADAHATFEDLFAGSGPTATEDHPDRIVLFGTNAEPDLFTACCHTYGDVAGKRRLFTLGQGLLLYAVLLHRIHTTEDFRPRLRTLRNLVAASEDVLRNQDMPRLVRDVEELILRGDLDQVAAFNQAQVEDEKLKARFLQQNPELTQVAHQLEDHPILRGCLSALELDAASFAVRASAFHRLFSDEASWPLLTAALLATGEYQRRRPGYADAFLFGSSVAGRPAAWRELLTGARRESLATTRSALAHLLDTVATGGDDIPACLRSVRDEWLGHARDGRHLDWRYYLVAYDCMRSGDSGLYYSEESTPGYAMIMLRRTQLNSWYRDPYLLAIYETVDKEELLVDPWFSGYQSHARWLRLDRSGSSLRNVAEGFELASPSDMRGRARFITACQALPGVVEDDGRWTLPVQQIVRDGTAIDIEDRVQRGAALVQHLLAAGL